MDFQYDEDLSQNDFFIQLKNEHQILLETAPLEGWVICVPRNGTFLNELLKEPDFLLAHILIPNDELPNTHYTNMISNNVQVNNQSLIVNNNKRNQRYNIKTRILFEEIFYTKDMRKYKIWCIETPLFLQEENTIFISNKNINNNNNTKNILPTIQNINNAITFIINETNSKYILRRFDRLCDKYKTKLTNGQEVITLEKIKDLTKTLYTDCITMTMLNYKLNNKCKKNNLLKRNINLSIEYYIINNIYPILFDQLTLCLSEENENFNKIIKNLSNIHLNDLNINHIYNNSIIIVRNELNKMNNYTNVSIIEKILCLKNAINAITIKQKNILCLDELIPIVVFSIIKSDIINWITTLYFLKEFHLTEITQNFITGQENFLITTLEASIFFIKTNTIKINYNFLVNNLNENTLTDISNYCFTTIENYLLLLFNKIVCNSDGDVLKLLKIFNKENHDIYKDFAEQNLTTVLSDKDVYHLEMCHPLCDCSKCIGELNTNVEKQPNINSCNDNGLTALHVTAIEGLTKICNIILTFKPNINVCDNKEWTALHYAAAKGHQNILLLLLHANANINAETNDKNTPLHLAALNGHENCVKALLYFAEQMRIQIEINKKNNMGNTALHNATKWGYYGIVETLLEYGVEIDLVNKINLTPIDVAHNSRIIALLHKSFVIIDEAENCTVKMHQQKQQINEDNIKLIDKVITAIVDLDTKLACFYLNINLVNKNGSNTVDCHPLCTCNLCKENQHYQRMKKTAMIRCKNLINTHNKDGILPIHAAVLTNNYELTKILMENNANPGLKTHTGDTALHLACLNDNYDIVKLLLNYQQYDIIDGQNLRGNTPMHIIIKHNNIKILNFLLKYEPDITIKNIANKLPKDIAKEYKFTLILNQLEIYENSFLQC